jgi:hypothetical protein
VVLVGATVSTGQADRTTSAIRLKGGEKMSINLVTVVLVLVLLVALLVAVLLGTPEQQQIIIAAINALLGA